MRAYTAAKNSRASRYPVVRHVIRYNPTKINERLGKLGIEEEGNLTLPWVL
jgi:hypothetical protein